MNIQCRLFGHKWGAPALAQSVEEGLRYLAISEFCQRPGCSEHRRSVKQAVSVGICGTISQGGMGCQKPTGHTGQHYHPSYGAWR